MKKMKKIEFSGRTQFFLSVAGILLAGLSFIGMFFNPFHMVTFAMSVALSIAIYKEKDW